MHLMWNGEKQGIKKQNKEYDQYIKLHLTC